MNRFSSRKHVGLLLGLCAVVASFAVAFMSSGAVYTSSTSNGANGFTSGTVTLGTTNGNGTAYTAFTATGMAPGTVTFSDVRVVNNGSLTLRYSMDATPTALSTASGGIANGPQLAADMQFGVKLLNTGVTVCNDANYNAASVTGMALVAGGFGSTLNAPKAVFGSPAQGAQGGDRTLAPGAAEIFCMKAVLPSTTANATQNASATFRLDFDAEQTVNN